MKYKNITLSKYNLKNILNIKKIFIDKVGIKNYYHPFILDCGNGRLQKVIGL